ncbi:MAG: argininosuccinate lyase [Rhodomicrobium sp.]|nr:MAG: argininosuccinate lyase [Rhodomicrobium sp.]
MTNKMWGGRFASGPSEIMEEINASIGYDQRLYNQDIDGSLAHAKMLGDTGILTAADVKKISKGLEDIRKEIADGKFEFSRQLEDIHMNVEQRLRELIGDTAGRLHTARSRNDQVATDFKLYIRQTIDHLAEQIGTLQYVLAQKAAEHADVVMPGYTHLQSAQPVTFGHHCLAYVEMLGRDRSRFKDARKRLNECPLGAAALAGTSFPIDRKQTAKALGFDRPTANSLDSVADRDFVLEALSAASISAIHLSRFAEELVIWSSAEFRFIHLSDGYTTGSSIMPQKRNPDAAELIRAKIGRILGAFNSLAIVMKGLPLAYSKDMQEDKEVAFDALDNYSLALAAMTGMISDMEPNVERLAKSAGGGFSTATDIADWLVRVLALPFRDAHHITGSIVAMAEKQDLQLDQLSLEDMQKVEPKITKDIFNVLSVENSVKSRTSYGGTAPTAVRKMANKWIKALEKEGLSS